MAFSAGQFEQDGQGPDGSDSGDRVRTGGETPFLFPEIFDRLPQRPRPSWREEITSIISNQSTKELSPKEKKNVGDWLKTRHNKMVKVGASDIPGIGTDDLIESYSGERWSDGSKFLRADRRMMKSVAQHFNEIALAGKSATLIEEEDVDGLIRGAKVKRTEADVTSTFPDGSFTRRTKAGDLLKKGVDGSISYHSAVAEVELPANGQGYLKFSLPAGQSTEMKLTKRSDGIWTGSLFDSEVNLAIDEHSVRLTTREMDMLLTSNGGFIRDPSDPASGVTYINPDGSISMTESNGTSAEIAKTADGIVLAQVSDGSREVQYPIDVTLVNDGKGKIRIQSKGVIPNIVSSSDGELTVTREGVSSSAKPGADGNSVVTSEDGVVVTRQKDGNIVVSIHMPVESPAPLEEIPAVHFAFSPQGDLTISTPFGEPLVLHPPEIKRPK